MKSKTIALSLISLSILAFAGCTATEDTTGGTTETTTTTTTTDGTTPADSGSTTAGGEIKTPSEAKELNTMDLAGNKVTTYKLAGAMDVACEGQAKMVTEAGWKPTAGMESPIKSAEAWTQTFESGDQMVTLACVTDPTAKDQAMVTMTVTKNPLK